MASYGRELPFSDGGSRPQAVLPRLPEIGLLHARSGRYQRRQHVVRYRDTLKHHSPA
jgi:hypothetical protein